jgi:gas vesicle protein
VNGPFTTHSSTIRYVIIHPTMGDNIELAKDLLWKRQLRKEHATLLDDLEVQKAKFDAYAEEAKATQVQLEEQLSTLKSRLDKLAEDDRKHSQEVKEDLRKMQEKINEVEKVGEDVKTLAARFNATEGSKKAETERKCDNSLCDSDRLLLT